MVASSTLLPMSGKGSPCKGSTLPLKVQQDMSIFFEPAYVNLSVQAPLGENQIKPMDSVEIPVLAPFDTQAADALTYLPPPPGLPPLGSMVSAIPGHDTFTDLGQTLKAAAAYGLQDLPWTGTKQRAMTWPMVPAAAEEQKSMQQKHKKDNRIKRHNVLLIATHLNELQQEDPGKILIVRKINRLGFDSAEKLKAHFEQYGHVDKVRLSNAHAKQPGNFRSRVRPSGIAFLLFEDSQDATRALEAGESQFVAGMEVFVRRFERRQGDSISDEMSEAGSGDKQNAKDSPMKGANDEDDELASEEDNESRPRNPTW